MTGVPFFLTAFLAFLTLATILTVLHELGHYLAGRWLGAKAEAFAIGFGPELIGYTDKLGTRWKLCPVPIGGYVKFAGETHPKRGEPPTGFAALARWRRAAIVFAGPLVNILICVVMLAGLYSYHGIVRLSPTLDFVVESSTAHKAGLLPGDTIQRWNGQEFDGSQRLIRHVRLHPGETIAFDVTRNGKPITLAAPVEKDLFVDRWNNRVELGALGIGFTKYVVKERNPFKLVMFSARESTDLLVMQGETIMQVIRGLRPIYEVSGPIRIAKAAGEQYISGWTPFLFFTAMLSIAIAFMNLLPIPGLDGGFLMLYATETAIRRDVSPQAFKYALRTGYVMLGTLMIFAFSNDIRVLFFAV